MRKGVEVMKFKEVWRDVKGYEGFYKVSNYGRVMSVDRTVVFNDGRVREFKGVLIKQIVNRFGYSAMYLKKNGKQKVGKVHRLVAEAFIPNPIGKPQVNHIDSKRTNNKVENLEWVTPRENKLHSVKKGLGTKATTEKAKRIRSLYSSGEYTQEEIGKRFGMDQSNVSYIVNRKTWNHV